MKLRLLRISVQGHACLPDQFIWLAVAALVLAPGVHAQIKTGANAALKDIEPQARDQIRLLQEEKRSRRWF
jgi:hypothetical protein